MLDEAGWLGSGVFDLPQRCETVNAGASMTRPQPHGPQSILVIKLVEQSVDEEKLTINYTVIGKVEK